MSTADFMVGCWLLVEEVFHFVGALLHQVTGGFQAEGGGEEESVGGAELDSTCSHLDDEHPLVIFHHLELVIPEVEDVVDGLGGKRTIGGHQELGSGFLVSQDDGASLAGDGVDTQVLGEGHASVRVGGHFLGGECQGGEDEGDRNRDDVFHWSVDFRFDLLFFFSEGLDVILIVLHPLGDVQEFINREVILPVIDGVHHSLGIGLEPEVVILDVDAGDACTLTFLVVNQRVVTSPDRLVQVEVGDAGGIHHTLDDIDRFSADFIQFFLEFRDVHDSFIFIVPFSYYKDSDFFRDYQIFLHLFHNFFVDILDEIPHCKSQHCQENAFDVKFRNNHRSVDFGFQISLGHQDSGSGDDTFGGFRLDLPEDREGDGDVGLISYNHLIVSKSFHC